MRINDRSIVEFLGDNVCLTCHFNEMQHHLINENIYNARNSRDLEFKQKEKRLFIILYYF